MDDERKQLIDNIRIAMSDKETENEILKAAVRLIDAYSSGFNWTGVYMMRDGFLEIGPYVGPKTPHTKIELNSGICGAAATEKKSIVVDDVTVDSRFLTCSPATRSEIVVPLMDGDLCLGEIDIDSNQNSFFSNDDRLMLEEIAAMLVTQIKQARS
ncbi:MAG: GAF domain-containing protein [candidate division Zixibacteria bacterium]